MVGEVMKTANYELLPASWQAKLLAISNEREKPADPLHPIPVWRTQRTSPENLYSPSVLVKKAVVGIGIAHHYREIIKLMHYDREEKGVNKRFSSHGKVDQRHGNHRGV
jgi:hypothetical protein